MEEHRFDRYRGVFFSEIFGLMTFDGSAQGNSPCEVDNNEGLVDGPIEGRTGVYVESEVELKCEGNNNEGACDMLCQM